MSAPVLKRVRDNVMLVPDAADSFMRLEARVGRLLDVNRTYADYYTQLRMYEAWQRYVNSGYNPAYKPNHSRALHPDSSSHPKGLGWDSDDWRTPGFIELAAEYGWIRTAANDPTEQHHFEYQYWRDQHRNEPVPAGGSSKPFPQEPTEEEILMGAKEDIIAAIGVAQRNVLSGVRREERFRKVSNLDRTITIIGRPGKVLRLSNDARTADIQLEQIANSNPLLLNTEELNGSMPKIQTTALLTLVDAWDPEGEHGFGRFVHNIFEITGGSTIMVRSDGSTHAYKNRQQVWANLNPVVLFYNNVQVVALKKPNIAVLSDGREVALTENEVDRVNAQKPNGYVWS